MKRWMIRGKLNIEPIKEDKYWIENIQSRGWVNGQYLYYHRTCFDDAQDATMFRTVGSAKGKATSTKRMKVGKGYYRYIEDIEVVEVQILIPGEKNEN